MTKRWQTRTMQAISLFNTCVRQGDGLHCPCCAINRSEYISCIYPVLARIMSSKFNLCCCDPLKCHKKKRKPGASHNLRRVSKTLIEKFPSFKLTSRHKICPSCRIKLYKMPAEALLHSDADPTSPNTPLMPEQLEGTSSSFTMNTTLPEFQSDSLSGVDAPVITETR